jgi:Carboxypeptidase regulatory-like domain/TonB-dependent Receptor Plug Domain
MKSFRAFLLLLAVAALIALNAPFALAQTASTGALTGTVTDPSGAVIAKAVVVLTNIDTGQSRSVTTDANGSYKFSLIPPGNYSVSFSASGFKTLEVPRIAVNVTETPVLNRSLQVGAQTQQVTVESTAETIQTQNATVGTLVSGKEITDLPLSGRNYTQVIDLSPGVVANVASASAVGNGTQDINVNGMGSDQNNYMMDGVSQTNYGSGGAAQSGNFPGIAIPNPDSIQEFKIQTSQYDAQYGRNPGASVNVVTKGGTNSFHGDVWEFFRNSYFDGNDLFNKATEAAQGLPNKPQALDQNEFGGTLGGPVKKDKLFFFGSYQGLRQKNGIGSNGFGSALSNDLTLLPFNEPDGTRQDQAGSIHENWNPASPMCNYVTYRGYLGCAFANNLGFGTLQTVNPPDQTNPSNDAVTNINLIAVNLLRAKTPGAVGPYNNGFYFPSQLYKNGAPVCVWSVQNCTLPEISIPIIAKEDQYIANADYVISSKQTLSERYFFSKDPILQSFNCLGVFNPNNQCMPGAPENATFTAHNAVLKLTSVFSANVVNEFHVAFIRETTNAVPGNYVSACSVGISPVILQGAPCSSPTETFPGVNPILTQVPTFSLLGVGGTGGGWNQGGNFFASATNYFNTFDEADTLSWNHGRHALRFGAEVERVQYNWTLPARGGESFLNIADMLTSSSGSAATGTAATPNGLLANFQGMGRPNGNYHAARANAISAFVEDDIKVSPRLTLNLGMRWEYDGYPSDSTGLFTNTWPSAAALVNTGSFFLGDQVAGCSSFPCSATPNQVGTLAGFVVQSNYNPNVKQCGDYVTPVACGLVAPAGVFPGYVGGATGVYFNTNKTLVHGAPIYNFGPRIGLAWQPIGSKFVVRAGYGIFYDRVYANLLENNNGGNPPYSGSIPTPFPVNSQSLDIPDPQVGTIGWTPRTLMVGNGNATDGATTVTTIQGTTGIGGSSDSEFLSVPLIQEYNLDLQYEVAHDWVVELGYVGSHGTHLYDWNRPINVALLAAGGANGPGPNDPQNADMLIPVNSLPFNDTANTNPVTRISNNTIGNIPGRVSYLGFGTGSVANTNTLGDSLYNSLQAVLRHQFSHGLLLQASYTWSKLITNVNSSISGAGIAAGGNVLSGNAGANNPLDLGQQYGLAAFNRPQRLVVAYSYDFPYKRTDGFEGHLLSGWTLSGVTTIQDGAPFTVIDSAGGVIYYGTRGPGTAATPFGSSGSRAELASAGACTVKGCSSTVPYATPGGMVSRLGGVFGGPGYINPAAFAPAGGEPCIGGTVVGSCAASGGASGWGNSGTGIMSGPGQHNWDMSLIKNTKVTEGTSLQFRAEFYNIWNHPQFNPPNNNVNSASFGQISSSSVPPRVVQFALKYFF